MVQRARSFVLVAVTVLVCVGSTAPTALAGPTYSVMNAEGGIYWRSAPDWNTAVRINGFGVYNGEIIEPHCYQTGAGNVPGTADYMWEYASDVTGPGYGTGWVNEHFVNDGQPIDQPSPGVPPCNPPPPPAPGVGTGGVSGITQTSATLSASVNPNGGNVTDCHFEYGPTASYGASVGCSPAPGSGGSPVGVSASIGSLAANSSYHFRIVATNAGGTSYGGDATFVTLPYAPTVVTGAASSVTQTSAILNASVNPNGGAVSSCTIEYGPTVSYGVSVPCGSAPGAGTSPVVVSANAPGLNLNTTYHFRIVAENAGGAGYGSDQHFTTLGPPDFGRCVKALPETIGGKVVYKGGFTSVKCNLTSPTHTGKYEWLPGVTKGTLAIGLKSGSVILAAVGGTKITCTGATGFGQIDETKDLSGVQLTFTSCTSLSHSCTSNSMSEGTIVTTVLEGTLGWQVRSEQTVGLDLFPINRIGPVMSFRCVGSNATTVTGSVIAPMPAGKMLTSLALKFSAAKGIQRTTHLENEEDDVLIASLNGEATEQVGLTANLAMSSEEAIEINAAA